MPDPDDGALGTMYENRILRRALFEAADDAADLADALRRIARGMDQVPVEVARALEPLGRGVASARSGLA